MIEYLLKKRKLTIFFFVLLVLFGLFQFMKMPRQEIPDMTVRYALVTTIYPGATPETIETTITNELEPAIKEVDGVSDITSTSSEGVSTITVTASNDSDPEEVWDDLRKKIQDTQRSLPAGAETPIVNDDLIQTFIRSYAVTTENPEDLKKLNDLLDSWKDQLRTVDGIADVTITGLPEKEIHVDMDTQLMQQYNIAWPQVLSAIQAENEKVPIGDIDYNERNYQLRITDNNDIESLNKVIITRTSDGFPVYLEHIGKAYVGHKEDSYYGYYNGKPAVTLTISGVTGSDVPSLDERLLEKIDQLKETLPEGYELDSTYGQIEAIDTMFHDLYAEMAGAVIAVILVCAMGLNKTTTFMVALAIPTSMFIGFLFLPMFGITLNQMTIIGLIIVLGLLVDDAIVVNDNIDRRLTEFGETPTEAAIHGTKEVIISIVIATLATISAFLPFLFLPGDAGTFIKPIPVAIALTMLASMVMALAIIPIFREWHENRYPQEPGVERKPPGLLGKQIKALTDLYAGKMMPKVVKHPLKVGLAGLLIGTAAFGLMAFVPIELFPTDDKPQFTVNIEMPTGSSLSETDRVVKEIATWATEQPDIENVSAAAGGAAPQLFNAMPSAAGQENGQLSVIAKDGTDLLKVIHDWRAYLGEAYPGITITPELASAGVSMGSPIEIRLTGPEMDQLRTIADGIKTQIASVNGAFNIGDNVGTDRYSLEFQVNKAAMDQSLVSYTDLTTTLRLLTQGLGVGTFDTGNDLIDITLYLENENEDPNALFQRLTVMNAMGEQVPLAQIAELKPTFSVQQIPHYNLIRSISVTADLREGVTATEAMLQLQPRLEQMNLPDGYTWEVGGEAEAQAEQFGDLALVFMVAVVLIIVLILLQFYSFSIPAIIFTTIYLAVAGGIIGLFVSGTAFGFMPVMGCITLAGIVVRNGIVMIEFIVDRQREGVELHEAVIGATAARFRPILLTAGAAILGVLPIALKGHALFAPLAITIIFGVAFSTILTLFVVPSLYLVIAEWKEKRKQKKLNRKRNHHDEITL